MNKCYFCSAIDKNNKVREMQILNSFREMQIYASECENKHWQIEVYAIDAPTPPTPPKEVQYTPPPQWGGRVICVETGWLFKSVSAAAESMHGSQWALRKAILRNTVYHGFHWRMFGETEKKIEKFT